ncbi:hypothetical protein GCM10022215_16420 [Nocardioides fonticola]|uniref:Uncharacterized protein n=1 Tax=Nocardioides fonticola TaxID=450363 RepID=A0ABP7XHR7_9ACTN
MKTSIEVAADIAVVADTLADRIMGELTELLVEADMSYDYGITQPAAEAAIDHHAVSRMVAHAVELLGQSAREMAVSA